MRAVVFVVTLLWSLILLSFAEIRKCEQSPLKGVANPVVLTNKNDYKYILITPIAEIHLFYLPSGKPKMVVINTWDHIFWRDRNEEIRKSVYFWHVKLFPKPSYTFSQPELQDLGVQYSIFAKEGLHKAFVWVEERYPGITPRISLEISITDSGNRVYECKLTLFPYNGTLSVK